MTCNPRLPFHSSQIDTTQNVVCLVDISEQFYEQGNISCISDVELISWKTQKKREQTKQL